MPPSPRNATVPLPGAGFASGSGVALGASGGGMLDRPRRVTAAAFGGGEVALFLVLLLLKGAGGA
jgi:hypothetical protein